MSTENRFPLFLTFASAKNVQTCHRRKSQAGTIGADILRRMPRLRRDVSHGVPATNSCSSCSQCFVNRSAWFESRRFQAYGSHRRQAAGRLPASAKRAFGGRLTISKFQVAPRSRCNFRIIGPKETGPLAGNGA